MLTVHTAEPADIWPQGSGLSAEAEREIMELAKTVSQDEVDRSGLVFARWYIPFALAEGQWRQGQAQRLERRQQAQVEESANARRIAKLERKLAQSIDRINNNFKDLYGVIFGEKDDSTDDPQIIKLIRAIVWEEIYGSKLMRDTGIWNVEKLYGPGAACTFNGALWVSQQQSKGVEPGDGVCWRLTHKSDLSELRSMVKDVVRSELHKQTKGQPR